MAIAAQTPWGQLDYQGAKLMMKTETQWEAGWRVKSVSKEPWTAAWIDQMDPAVDVLWDVGANTGPYSLIAASRGVFTVAIEPGYANYAALCDNILANAQCAGRVLPLPVGLSDQTGIGGFSYRSLEAGAASHSLAPLAKAVAKLPVLVYCLDDLIRVFQLPAPTHVKLDVDGSELQVLRGARTTLAAGLIRSLMVEVQREPTAEIAVVGVLAESGYALVQRFDERDGHPIQGIYYGLFARKV